MPERFIQNFSLSRHIVVVKISIEGRDNGYSIVEIMPLSTNLPKNSILSGFEGFIEIHVEYFVPIRPVNIKLKRNKNKDLKFAFLCK